MAPATALMGRKCYWTHTRKVSYSRTPSGESGRARLEAMQVLPRWERLGWTEYRLIGLVTADLDMGRI